MVLLEGVGDFEIGQEMPEFNLKNIDGKFVSDKDLSKDLKMIVFTCNHCPYAIAAWPKLTEIYSKFKDKIDIVAINPNDAQKYPADSYEKMIEFAKNNSIEFPYLHDETQEIARKFGAKCTPDIFIFKDNRLVHRGRIDDNWEKNYSETSHELEEALGDIMGKGEVEAKVCPSSGCSIKWKD